MTDVSDVDTQKDRPPICAIVGKAHIIQIDILMQEKQVSEIQTTNKIRALLFLQ